MRKYILLLFSIVLFAPGAVAKTDCDLHINNYFKNNYFYTGGAEAAENLAVQRRCLHARNPIYSDIYEFKQKIKKLKSIDDNFLVLKNLIDYQEAAEVLADRGDINKSSEYIDKFNDILVKHYDKVLAAKILKEQVESGLISEAHQEELFEKLDKYLFKIGKCNPGICEGWGLISSVAGAFPKCAEDSCQLNITYESLYFALSKTTDNFPRATETIKQLLTKDFGSSKSNGEVKAPLIMALYYTDYDAFSAEAKNLLDKAKRTIRYDYQEAILLPIVTQMMIKSGQAENLIPYTETKYKNVAGLEVTLALLSEPLGDNIRQKLRSDLEIYYELTSACENYRIEEHKNGTNVLRQGMAATLTKDPELDLFLRQRIQNAYWVDGFGGLLNNKATSYWCSPSANAPEKMDPVFVSAQAARDFIREGFIDDVILLPLFAFNKIKAVLEGIKQSKKTLKVVYYNDKALEVARNTQRLEKQVERSLLRLNEMPEEIPYKLAAGQDFIPNYVGDKQVNQIVNNRSWRGGSGHVKTEQRRITYATGRSPGESDWVEGVIAERKSFAKGTNEKQLAKEKKLFEEYANMQMRYIGFDKSKKLAEALNMDCYELRNFISTPGYIDLLATANPERTEQIIKRTSEIYFKYLDKIEREPFHKFSFSYINRYGEFGIDVSRIRLVEETLEKDNFLKVFFKRGELHKPDFLSNSWKFSPKTPKESVKAYEALLGCTPQNPCYAKIDALNRKMHIFSKDKSKLIRITPHEYGILSDGKLNWHIHYYEISDDYILNHMFLLDLFDRENSLALKTQEEMRTLLISRKEIQKSPLIKLLDN